MMRIPETIDLVPVRRMTCALLALVAAAVTAACGGEERAPLLDLVQQASVARVLSETGNIDLGTYPARFHLVDGWSGADQEDDGVTFVWGQGYESTLRFVAWRRRQRRLILRGRAFGPARRGSSPAGRASESAVGAPDWRLDVGVNGMAVQEVRLEPGVYREYEIMVPGNVLRSGENVLSLGYRLNPGGTDPFVDESRHAGSRAVAWDRIELVDPLRYGDLEVDEEGGVLGLPLMTRVEYHLLGVPGAELVLEKVGAAHLDVPTESMVLEVELRAAGSEEGTRHFIRVGDEASGSEPVRLPLPLPGDRPHPVRISLMAVAQRPVPRGPKRLRLLRPAVRVGDGEPGAGVPAPGGPAGTTLPAWRGTARDGPVDVLVYLVDALRADHMGLYGYERDTSPNLDAFAEDAVVFRRGVANSAWTRSAVASLFTGLYPESHGVLGRDDALSPDARTLALLLSESGYATAAVVTNGNVSRGYGFPIGFDTWVQLREERSETIHRYSDKVNEEVFDWLDDRDPGKPFFLYAHTTDPHEPYTPPQPYRRRFAPGVAPGSKHRPIRIAELLEERPDFDLEALNRNFIDLYDAEIAFNDAQFGRLVEQLRSAGLYEDMLIVVLADHGEEFLDHGGWAHGKTLFGEQIDIPLIVKFPGNWAAGTRVDALAEQVDVVPTILDVLGLEVPAEVQGNSMLGAPLAGEFGPVGMAMAHLSLDGRRTAALMTDRWKLIRRLPSLRQTWGLELYDLFEDPGEQVDLSSERPILLGYLRYLLEQFERGRTEILTAGQGNPDPELVERLRELGYLR